MGDIFNSPGSRSRISAPGWLLCGFLAWNSGVAAPVSPSCDHQKSSFRVDRVLDGDSLRLADGREVRLIGVNAPDYGKHGGPDQPLTREAHQELSELVAGRCVVLVLETEPIDHYGRTLAHVVLADGTNVEETLLRKGLAWFIAIAPNVAWTPRLSAAEAQARARRLGLWNVPEYEPQPAETLTPNDVGFHIIQGTVRRVGESEYTYYIDLSPSVTVTVARADWNRYFRGNPQNLIHRRVVVRGWLTEHERGLRMRVTHPAMLTFAN